MHRRAALTLFGIFPALGSAAAVSIELRELAGDLAAALTAGDLGSFFRDFHSSTPGLSTLRANLSALVAQANAVSSVQPVEETSEARSVRSATFDWYLELLTKDNARAIERRRETVTLGVQLMKGRYKIVRFEPVTFLAPPGA